MISRGSINYPWDDPHFFIQNSQVNKFNLTTELRLHQRVTNIPSRLKIVPQELTLLNSDRDRILKQILLDLRKTKQLISNLHIAEGERTDKTINVRTNDGIINGASNFC